MKHIDMCCNATAHYLARCSPDASCWYARHEVNKAAVAWEIQAQQDRGSTLMESFTLGWLNILLQHTWVPVLEKHAAKHAHEVRGPRAVESGVLTASSAHSFVDQLP
jgi:hypothetical protein